MFNPHNQTARLSNLSNITYVENGKARIWTWSTWLQISCLLPVSKSISTLYMIASVSLRKEPLSSKQSSSFWGQEQGFILRLDSKSPPLCSAEHRVQALMKEVHTHSQTFCQHSENVSHSFLQIHGGQHCFSFCPLHVLTVTNLLPLGSIPLNFQKLLTSIISSSLSRNPHLLLHEREQKHTVWRPLLFTNYIAFAQISREYF